MLAYLAPPEPQRRHSPSELPQGCQTGGGACVFLLLPLTLEGPKGQTSQEQSSGTRKAWRSQIFLGIQEKPEVFRRNLSYVLGLRNKKYKKCVYLGMSGGKLSQKLVYFFCNWIIQTSFWDTPGF